MRQKIRKKESKGEKASFKSDQSQQGNSGGQALAGGDNLQSA